VADHHLDGERIAMVASSRLKRAWQSFASEIPALGCDYIAQGRQAKSLTSATDSAGPYW